MAKTLQSLLTTEKKEVIDRAESIASQILFKIDHTELRELLKKDID